MYMLPLARSSSTTMKILFVPIRGGYRASVSELPQQPPVSTQVQQGDSP